MPVHRRKTNFFRTLLGWGLGIPMTGLVAFLSILSVLITGKGSTVHFFSRHWGRIMLSVAGIKVSVTGQEFLPEEGKPVLIIANHQSMIDILVFSGFFPMPFVWIAKKELFKIPLFGNAMKAAGFIEMDRLQKENAFHALEQAAEDLKHHPVVIFPEGTRSKDGSVGRFKAGASFLAHASQTALLPVTITGSWQCLPPHKKMLSPGPISIIIDPPVSIQGKSRRDVLKDLNTIRDIIAERVEKSHLLTT